MRQRSPISRGASEASWPLTLALGKNAGVVLLDEPLAELVPLARRAAMCLVMAEVAERSATVVYSTHVLAELETVCDHVVVLGRGRVLVHGEVEALVGSHSVVTGPALQLARLGQCVGGGPGGGTGTLVLERPPLALDDHGLVARPPSVSELCLAYLSKERPGHESVAGAGR